MDAEMDTNGSDLQENCEDTQKDKSKKSSCICDVSNFEKITNLLNLIKVLTKLAILDFPITKFQFSLCRFAAKSFQIITH